MTDPKALFVKNLPPLPSGKFEELLSHYKCVDSVALAQGSIAILRFETIADANKARASLHNARILDSVLEVRSYVPKSIQQPSIKTETPAEPEPTPSFTGHPIASKLGFHYPPNPHLEYVYPPPNEDILCNILNAIDNCPKLYTQVLHLMNKMNLPPPFRPSSATPLSIDYQSIRNKVKKKEKAKHDDLLSSDESEISDVESEHRVEPRKRPPIVPSELLHPISKRKKTEEPIPPFSKPPVAPPQPVHQLHHIHIHSNNAPAPDPPSIDSGVTEPQEEKHEEISVVKEKVQDRWNESEILERFPNYKEGTPSSKLYIKNIAKHVTEDQFRTVFRECDCLENIDLKGKGRMRGQAFVTFSNVDSASQALARIHGVVLEEKPLIVVSFLPLFPEEYIELTHLKQFAKN